MSYLRLHEHCTRAVVLKATGHERNLCFGAEFVAMKIGIESLRGLRYKLHINPQHTAASKHTNKTLERLCRQQEPISIIN